MPIFFIISTKNSIEKIPKSFSFLSTRRCMYVFTQIYKYVSRLYLLRRKYAELGDDLVISTFLVASVSM